MYPPCMSRSKATEGAPLTAILGGLEPLVVALAIPEADEPRLAEVVIWDALDELVGVHNGVLLMIGMDASHPLLGKIIETAARLGYAAIVIKCRSASVSEITAAANRVGIALLAAQDAASWTSIETLLTTAISAAGIHPREWIADPVTGDLFTLANRIADLIGGAITIEDVDRQVLAYSNIPGHAIDTSRQRSIVGRQVPDLPEHVNEYRQVAHATTAVRFEGHADTLPRVCMPVRAGGRLLGSIWAIDTEEQGERIGALLQDVSSQVALHLLRIASQQDIERHRRSEMLASALSQRYPAGVSNLLLAKDFPAALIGFRMVAADEAVDHHRLVRLVALIAEAATQQAWCAEADSTIFVLLPQSDRLGAGRVAQLAANTSRSVGRSLGLAIKSAYAAEIYTHEQLPSIRADIGCALRRAEFGPIDVVRERYLVAFQALLESDVAKSSQMIPQVAAIVEHDNVHGTEYARTLLAHLECSGDVRRIAVQMSVHENSHRYRMRKIQSEFGIDLANAELCIVAWLQLRAMPSMSALHEPSRGGYEPPI